MCGFERSSMSLAVVIPNSLLHRSPWDKKAKIRQQPELADGAVMTVLAPWRD